MNARRLTEILRENLAYFNWRVIGAGAPSYPKMLDNVRGSGKLRTGLRANVINLIFGMNR